MTQRGARGTRVVRELRNELNRSSMCLVLPVKTTRVKRREVDTVLRGRRYRLSVKTGEDALPHGIDNDVLTAIITLAIEYGLPEDNTIRTSGRELLKTAMFGGGGREHARLLASLLRLLNVTFVFGEGWYDAKRKRWKFERESFRFLEKVRWGDEESESGDVELRADAPLVIVLNTDLAEQLRAGHVYLPDPHIIRAVRDAPARSLYNFLEAHRERERLEHGVLPSSLTFELEPLAQILGIGLGSEMRSDVVRRKLGEMGSSLTSAGYLEGVSYDGRGLSANVTISFREEQVEKVLDESLVALLCAQGMNATSARHLALSYPENVRRGVAVFEVMMRQYARSGSRPRNPMGLLTLAIKNPEKYQQSTILEQGRGGASVTSVAARAVDVVPLSVAEVEEEDARREREERTEWEALSVEGRVSRFVSRVSVLGVRCAQEDVALLGGAGYDLMGLWQELVRVKARGGVPQEVLDGALSAVRAVVALGGVEK
ncbi:replication initiator protein A [Deinococcus pimensis]|uniref:replication initiator protein A n=1 Tax=Deinococcus pimensis TaxID=309888 RepID=UPI0012F919D2|nr:replication initiator protein A [Deinococcus pimensis]